MLIKLAGDLDEITALHRVAGFVVRTVAPDAQRHAIARVREDELAIRLLFAGEFCRDGFELHVDARFERSLRHGLANFFERQQLHRGRKFAQITRHWTGETALPNCEGGKGAAPRSSPRKGGSHVQIARAWRRRSRRRPRGHPHRRSAAISGRRLSRAR